MQEDFSKFYRAINEDDESKFTAKLTPSEGRLDLDVNFYERGLFPPEPEPEPIQSPESEPQQVPVTP